MKTARIAIFGFLVLLVSCSTDNGDLPGGTDTTGGNTGAVDVKTKVWQLYSRDLVYSSGTVHGYISRDVLTDCFESINFVTNDSLVQVDSCAGSPPTTVQASWHAYSTSSYQVELKTEPNDVPLKSLYSLSKDTLQLRVLPDSAADITMQRIYTYRAIPK